MNSIELGFTMTQNAPNISHDLYHVHLALAFDFYLLFI